LAGITSYLDARNECGIWLLVNVAISRLKMHHVSFFVKILAIATQLDSVNVVVFQ
jgi:hypothetical protein